MTFHKITTEAALDNLDSIKDGVVNVLKDIIPQSEAFMKDVPSWAVAAVLCLLGLSVLFVLIGLLKALFNWAVASAGNSGRSEERAKKMIIADAKKFASKKEPGRAAELLISVGEVKMAADVLEKGGMLAKAGQLCENFGDLERAIRLYQSAGENSWLAEAYSKRGDFSSAADTFMKIGKKILAAEAYEKAGTYDKAAYLYEEAGHTLSAAVQYEKASNYQKAAMLFDRAYIEITSSNEVRGPGHEKKLNDYSFKAGQYYLKSGDYEKSAEAFARCNSYIQAGESALLAKKRAKAAEYFISGRDFERAAAIYREDGNTYKACEVMAEMFISEGSQEKAGDMYLESGMNIKAAEMYDLSGNYRKAGEAYLREGEFNAAADMFYRVGDDAKAAEMFERAENFHHAAETYTRLGNVEKAADMTEKSGEFMKAAEMYKDLGLPDKEMSALQKVGPDDQNYYAIAVRLAESFKESGNLKLAAEKYIKAIGKSEPDSDNIALFYGLGAVFEAAKKYAEAVLAYQKVQLVDFGYKDVADRMRICEDLAAKASAEAQAQKESSKSANPLDDADSRYEIVKEVGRGGMGVVYLAKDKNLNRMIALKLLPQHISDTPTVIKRFAAEARSAAQLNHANIVTLLDFHQGSGKSFITMEYVEGVTLKRVIGMEQRIPIIKALKIIYQCCQGLDYAHSKGIIHRDIKPSNIMISKENIVKIMDFGLAKVVGEETITESGMVSGTLLYMPPEQLMGKELDKTTDLYALGLVMYELLTGTHPFASGDPAYHHINTVPAPPSSVRPEIPKILDMIVLKCLEKDRAKRFPTAMHLAASFKQVPLK